MEVIIMKNQTIPWPSICTDLKSNKLYNKILLHLAEECKLEDEAQVQNYIMNRKESILKNHINTVCKIYKPGEGGQHYFMTKLTPKNRNHAGKIYAKTQEELENKILAHYLKIEEDDKITVRETLLASVGDITNKKNKTGIRTVQRFDKHFSMLSNVKLSSLSEDHIRRALDAIIMSDVKITLKEFNETITSLNKIAYYCAYEHLAVCDIKSIIENWRNIKLKGKHIFKDTKKQTKNLAFNRAEASRIVRDALRHPTYKSLAVALLITTGLRAGELLALEMDDIYLKECYLWIHQIEDTKIHVIEDYVKENKCREVYLSDEALNVMKACLSFRAQDSSDSPYLFLNENSKDGKMHLRAIDDYLRVKVHRDILGYGADREARSPHDCRRTYASLEYINGTDIYTLKNQLGHSSISQTEEYIKDVIEAQERKAKLKGSGLILDTPVREKAPFSMVDAV